MTAIKDELSRYILQKTQLTTSEEKVHLSPIFDSTGKLSMPANSIAITLINIEEERINPISAPKKVINDEQIDYLTKPIRVNLYLMFTANFSEYNETLKFISYVIEFFQTKPYFNHSNLPSLDEGIKKLVFEMHPQSLEQIKDIWSFLGGRYLPSVLYRVRGIVIHEEQTISEERRAANYAVESQ